MLKLRAVWRSFFDVRPGEYLRTVFVALYLLFILFAYYILKPVSRALFLNSFDIDRLPYLMILIAFVGGILAYLYTRLAVKSSLPAAVTWSTALTVGCLLALSWLLGLNQGWVLYVFNIWVGLFSVMMVAQGWLIAANVFTSREAKRLYGLLGMSAVLGAAIGGKFTADMVRAIGPRKLVLASALMVLIAYLAFRALLMQKGVSLTTARAAESEEAEFHFSDIVSAIRHHRHLQVIVAIITVTFIVDVTIDYQFNAMAKLAYRDKNQLTAFLGNFYGIYLNLINFFLQFFMTAAVVRWFGVGGTLQIMPVTISATALGTFFLPGVKSSAALRLTEAATRYTLNRTGMELLYVPLPAELKNRTKAFVDIFVDRMGRGLGGVILIVCTSKSLLGLTPTQIPLVTVGFSLIWILLSARASREYLATVRRRLASRRLDIESVRVSVNDPVTLTLLQQTACSENPRQAAYALGLLAEVQDYDLGPLLNKLVESSAVELRAKTFELARAQGYAPLLDRALAEARARQSFDAGSAVRAAVSYALAISPEAQTLLREFLETSDPSVWEGAMNAVQARPELGTDVITREWIAAAAQDADVRRRALAARAVAVTGDRGSEVLHRLLADQDPRVVAAACRAAGMLRNRDYVHAMVRWLGDVRVRGAAIQALAAYGPAICGTLGDVLEDASVPVPVRKEVPRALRLIVHQRSVDVLLTALYQPNAAVRSAALRALNRLRESAPQLHYADELVTVQIHQEARYYFELLSALAPFSDRAGAPRAAKLLARTIEERLGQTLERLFRLLGLCYPPREMYSAYLAVSRHTGEQHSAALEFLDSVLDRDLKRVLLPLLDAPNHVLETGRHLFGIEVKTPETAIRDLICCGDPWLVACAVAAAGELRMHRLAPDIEQAARNTGAEVAEVARSAVASLAA
ncbi:MAG TPA: Npt1/Npt2 family nucleotide transporter [Bryobacteraceae bacterium]|nr:Npt1/Npt2 family nucleotide transporter [Bryobacteraceae bacterium]